MTGLPAIRPVASAEHWGSRALFLACFVMLGTRLSLLLGLDVSQWSDLQWYHERAVELLERGTYSEKGVPTAYWPVGYPAFLAGVMAVAGQSAFAGQIANLALSLACAVMLCVWSIRQFGDARVGGVAALLLAVYPNHMGYTVGLYSEPLFTALLLALFLLATPKANWWRMAFAGVVAGIACLVKAQSLLLAPLMLLALCLPDLSWAGLRSAVARATLATLVMAATIAPWTYRNWVVFHDFIPISTNGGMSLLAANNPAMTTSLLQDYNDRHPMVKEVQFSVADQAQADRRAKAAAWKWIRDNPGQFLVLMPKKLFRLWASDGESEWLFQAGYPGYDDHRLAFRAVRVINQLFYLSVLALAALALLRWSPWRDPRAYPVPLMLAFFSALCMVFSGQSRYHAPLMPFILAYAAWMMVNWNDRRSRS